MISIQIDHKRLSKLLETTPEELDRVMPGVAKRIGYRYLGFHRARRMRGPPGVFATGTPPSERGLNGAITNKTSGLKAHFRVDVSGTKFDRLSVTMGTRSIVALQQEQGATLTAGGGRYMAIPLSKWGGTKLTRATIARARKMIRKDSHVRLAGKLGFDLRNSRGRIQKERLVVFKAKDGRVYLAEPPDPKAGIRGRFRIWFTLKKVAILGPRLDFLKLWKDFEPTAIKMFNGGLAFALAAVRRRANG